MNRRFFLKSTAGLFLAPAIVKAENIMKIVMPPPMLERYGNVLPLSEPWQLLEPALRTRVLKILHQDVEHVKKMGVSLSNIRMHSSDGEFIYTQPLEFSSLAFGIERRTGPSLSPFNRYSVGWVADGVKL